MTLAPHFTAKCNVSFGLSKKSKSNVQDSDKQRFIQTIKNQNVKVSNHYQYIRIFHSDN